MKSFEKGTITELEVQLFLVKNGYKVFIPINEGCNIDLVFIDKVGTAKKVQVKKSKQTASGFFIELRYSLNKKRTGKLKYSKNEIDYFATSFNNKCYLIPINDVKNKSTVVLRINEKYKNQNNPFFAKNYELQCYD